MSKTTYGWRVTIEVPTPDGGVNYTTAEYGISDRDFAVAANRAMSEIWKACAIAGSASGSFRRYCTNFWRNGSLQKGSFSVKVCNSSNALLAIIVLDQYPCYQPLLLGDDIPTTPKEQEKLPF